MNTIYFLSVLFVISLCNIIWIYSIGQLSVIANRKIIIDLLALPYQT